MTLFALPAFTTNKLQPLDACVFSAVKSEFSRIAHEAYVSKAGIVTQNVNVPRILATILSKQKIERLARSGFEKTGICPFNPAPLIAEAEKSQTTRLNTTYKCFTKCPDRLKGGLVILLYLHSIICIVLFVARRFLRAVLVVPAGFLGWNISRI